MKKYFHLLLDLFYPKICVSCKSTLQGSEQFLCLSCLLTLPRTDSHIHQTDLIDRKFWGKLDVANTYAFLQFTKKGKVQQILHQLKYKNKPELAEYLGKLYGNELKDKNLHEKVDFVVGIPLHKDKLKIRGYNQADHFAKGLAEVLGVPCETDILERTIFTNSQTSAKGRIGRYNNIQGVFKAINEAKIINKRILLVDDVLTSGATLEVAGEVLKQYGCAELYIATIATAI